MLTSEPKQIGSDVPDDAVTLLLLEVCGRDLGNVNLNPHSEVAILLLE